MSSPAGSRAVASARAERTGTPLRDATTGEDGLSRNHDFERIEPTPVTPRAPVQGLPRRDVRRSARAARLGAALAAAGLLAAALVWWLPDWIAPAPRPALRPTPVTEGAPARRESPAAESPDGLDTEAVLARRQQIERLEDEWAARRARLEDRGVERWAANRYAEARSWAERAGRRLEARDHEGAAQGYREAIGIAEGLLEQAEAVLADALGRAAQALADDDADAAQAAFSLALTVAPDHAGARDGMRRAQNLERVQALLRSARVHEQDGELAAARADYREALALGESAEAVRAGLARVEQALAARAFQQKMSEGLAAIEGGKYAAARQAFQAAAAIRPDAPEAADGLAQAEAGLTLRAIAEHRARAEAFEASERWREALDAYESALALDPTLAFAQAGRERAVARAELDERLQLHIDQPQRLSSANVRASAQRLLAEGRAIPQPGPGLQRRLDALDDLLAAAQTPVPVRLSSDNRTTVLVHHVGELGTFESKEIQLLPGGYVAIGRCPGYRDVRLEFRVIAGEPAGPIDIRCKEKI